MNKDIAILLEDSIRQIDSLCEYYYAQEDSVIRRVKEKAKKYKYGIKLDKFFITKAKPEMGITLTQEEEALIEEVIDEFEIETDEGDELVKIRYKLKDTFLVDKKYEIDPIKAREEFFSLIQQPDILSESVLMMLLIRFEDSISKIFRYLMETNPQAFLSSKTITYSELMSIQTDVGQIKDRFITKEVEELMREPLSNWYGSFCKKQKASFLFINNLFEEFKEIYYRRNLVVHNQGYINDVYLSNVKTTNAKLGEKLSVSNQYLQRAFCLTRLIMIDTFFGLRKTAGNKKRLISWISSYGYECLVEKRWEEAKHIFEVLLQDTDGKQLKN